MDAFFYGCIAFSLTLLHILCSMLSDSLRFASSGVLKDILQKRYNKSEDSLARKIERMELIFEDDGEKLREMEWATSVFLLLGLCFVIKVLKMNGIEVFGTYIFSKAVLVYLGTVFFCSSILLRGFSEPFAESILLYLYPLWITVHLLLKPLTFIIEKLQKLILRVIGHEEEEEEEEQEQKILDSVDDGEKAGVFEDSERKMIENLIEFKDRDVGEAMTPRTEMVAVSLDTKMAKVVTEMQESNLSRILVYEENRDHIIGFVHVRDLLPYWNKNNDSPELSTLLHKPYFVPETKKIRSLFQELKDKHLHIAVVLDEYGGTAGLITLEDIIEEIVGEIVDEHQEEEDSMLEFINEHEVKVNARLRVSELAEAFDIEIEENEQYDSVGGLLISFLGKIPVKGEQGEFEEIPLSYKVIEASERKIEEIVFKKLETESED